MGREDTLETISLLSNLPIDPKQRGLLPLRKCSVSRRSNNLRNKPEFKEHKPNFSEFIQADQKHEDQEECHWFVMKAITSSVNLYTLDETFIALRDFSGMFRGPIPVELIFHFFLKNW